MEKKDAGMIKCIILISNYCQTVSNFSLRRELVYRSNPNTSYFNFTTTCKELLEYDYIIFKVLNMFQRFWNNTRCLIFREKEIKYKQFKDNSMIEMTPVPRE